MMELDLNIVVVGFKGFYSWPIRMARLLLISWLRISRSLWTWRHKSSGRIFSLLTFPLYSQLSLPTCSMFCVDRWKGISGSPWSSLDPRVCYVIPNAHPNSHSWACKAASRESGNIATSTKSTNANQSSSAVANSSMTLTKSSKSRTNSSLPC